jgi:hypothetical protein
MKNTTLTAIVLGISLLLGGWVSNYASTNPDGLEWVAENLGFLEKGEGEPVYTAAPMPDYAVPGIVPSAGEPNTGPNLSWLSNLIAGVGGTILTFGLALLLGELLKKRSSNPAGQKS